MTVYQKLIEAARVYPVTTENLANLLREAASEIWLLQKDKERLDWLAGLDNAVGGVVLPAKHVFAKPWQHARGNRLRNVWRKP